MATGGVFPVVMVTVEGALLPWPSLTISCAVYVPFLSATKVGLTMVALLNAAAALIVAGKAKDLKEGVAIGVKTLDSGAAAARLKQLVAVSNG